MDFHDSRQVGGFVAAAGPPQRLMASESKGGYKNTRKSAEAGRRGRMRGGQGRKITGGTVHLPEKKRPVGGGYAPAGEPTNNGT
jgi:hypothetical protein